MHIFIRVQCSLDVKTAGLRKISCYMKELNKILVVETRVQHVDTMTLPLTYRKLDPTRDEIRLIKILPSGPTLSSPGPEVLVQQAHDQISCQLSYFPLKDCATKVSHSQLNWNIVDDVPEASKDVTWGYTWGDYGALSYTWGDVTPIRDILINGHKVSVRSNLEAALRALRNRSSIQAGLLIWIDALCINQEDINERNQEVKRMRTIYKTAREVIVWLGAEGDQSSKVMRLIRSLSRAVKEETPSTLQVLMKIMPEVFESGAWQALGQLMYRSYWERV